MHPGSGQKQDGIDFFGGYSDGTTATWQCKDWVSLSKTQVDKIIADTAVDADRHVLAFAGIAGASVRTLVNATPSWEMWDQRDLSNLVRLLPIYLARTLLDHHFGSIARNRFLPLASADVFLGLEEYFEPLLGSGRRFHHSAAVVGRDKVVGELTEAILDPAGPSVIVLDAPGGRGKSRTALEVLRRVTERRPFLPVLVVNDRRVVDGGALGELPDSQAVVLIEDAHRDPDGIATTLQHARSTPGVKVLLTTRPSAGDQVRRSVKAARFDGTEILDASLEPLTLAASRELVAELVGAGPTLPAAFVESLAREARATPLIAVLAVGMIRRGELSAALSVDAHFRQEVLDRYGDVLTDGVEGMAPAAVRSVLALVAALGPLDVSDADLVARLAAFLGRTGAELLGDLERLVDHGVLLQRGELLRVVPDVVADEVLRREAVRLGQSTGYVQKLWDEFSDGYVDRLLKSLADLDWQLRSGASQPYPVDVFDGVWSAFRDWLLDQNNYDRTTAIGWLAPLAFTQPGRVVEVVADLHDSPGADATMWGRTFTQQDVSSACPRLLSSTLAGAPALLETVLELLWRLAKADTRETPPRSDHPIRVLCDLGDLAEHPANGPTVIRAVRRWLASQDTEDGRSPLEVLTPLVSKEGTTHTWIAHAVQMQAYLIDPVAVRGVRDGVRDTVREAVRGASVARVLAAVSLLETALRPPRGFFGEPVQVERVTQWESDDLATLQVLAEIAAEPSEPLVRLRVRDAAKRHAERAESPAVRAAAADLVSRTTLPGDRLTDILRTGPWDALPDGEGRAAAPDGLDVPPTTEGVEDDFAVGQARRREQEVGAATELLASGDAATAYERLRERAVAVAGNSSGPSRLPGLAALLEALFAADEPAAQAFCAWIGSAEPGPLDGYVAIPLRAMLLGEPDRALTVLRDLLGSRRTLALGALEVFRRPVPQVTGLSEVLLATLEHEDPGLAAAALAYLGPSLRENVGVFAAVLRGGTHDSAHQVAYALESASEHNSPAWVEAFTQADADDICSLLELLPDWSYPLQMLASAIAARFPETVLSVITARAVGGPRAPHEVLGLGAALSASPDALHAWLRSSARAWDVDTSESWKLQVLWPLLAGSESYENGRPEFHMSDGARRASLRLANGGDARELNFLASALAQCDTVALTELELAAALVGAGTRLSGEQQARYLANLRASAMSSVLSRSPGEPPPAQVAVLDLARDLSSRPALPEPVQDFFRSVAESAQSEIEATLERDLAEDER